MKRSLSPLTIIALALAVVALPAHRASADDETDDVEIKIQAPLDAADCAAVPPTITVLGLAIDVGTAQFDGEDDGNGDHHGGEGPDCEDDGGGGSGGAGSCEALVAGQFVTVKLTSDAPPLVGTKIEQDDDGEEAEIKAPLQAVDATAMTITVLGLTIDVSGAEIEGADDDDSETGGQPVDLSQLVVGQFIEVELDAAQLPTLVATELEVKNFGNVVDVEVEDPDGDAIEDVDDDGDPVNDIEVDVTETVKVQNPTPGARGKVARVLRFHTTTNGSFRLGGLPTGSAKLTVTRVADGVTLTRTRSVRIKGNAARSVRLKLRRPR